MSTLEELADAIIKGNIGVPTKSDELVKRALDEGISVKDILQKGLIGGMGVIGERFKKCEVYVPEVLIAARAMKAAMAVLKPLLATSDIQSPGTIVIGTVKGDLHDIGKNLVAMMLEGAGFNVVDAGIDVPPEKFIEAAKKAGAQVVAMSALLTTTMPGMKTTINAIKASDISKKVKTIIGGAPVTQAYANEIHADGFAPDAASAVDKVKALVAA
jgi:5-methyltetrahydrofolate--homocysteine methyltransferase